MTGEWAKNTVKIWKEVNLLLGLNEGGTLKKKDLNTREALK